MWRQALPRLLDVGFGQGKNADLSTPHPHILNNNLDGVYSASIQGANRHMFNDRGG